MASISIYVPDELQERMSQVEVNWSEVCKHAIESELSRREATQRMPTIPVIDESDEWITIALDAALIEQGTVIKPSMAKNYSGKTPQEVMLVSSWIADVNNTIANNVSIGGARASQFLEGSYPAELLIPGQPWLQGHLKLNQQFTFRYPAFDKQLLENSEL